eukprot:Phypoly_transcript_03854.p1 GENE.Phypoly_transcript_03854~~Phypoly_transcript_03854.p1  ORF type:complete len:610 (+),score=129.54 Phypoly_transcript_03854:253-2082(+)
MSRFSVMFGGPPEEEAAPAQPVQSSGGNKEERIDEEQTQKFNEIVEILLAGGYFRARISGLSPFDKVIGGMAWSITASNVDVDVDVFFQENATIGQRIVLSEALIVALRKMKCPYPLQAQHIQGLNYIVIYPVIQFLIKKVIETREETGDLLRMYSESQFGKSYKMPNDVEFDRRKPTAVSYAFELEDRYKPQRTLKRQKTTAPAVQQTLLEYGKLNRMSKMPEKKQSDKAAKLESKLGGRSDAPEVDEAAEEERRISDIMKGMGSVKATTINVKGIIDLDEIKEASQIEGADSTDAQAGAGQKNLAEKQHKSKVAALNKQIDHQTAVLATIKEKHEEQSQKAEELQEEVATKAAFNERIIAETAKLDSLENEGNAKQLAILRHLVGLNESLRGQEVLFKGNCKKQLLALQESIANLKKEGDVVDEDSERKKLIKDTYAADKAKSEKILQLRNKKNRDIALLERRIDEVPSRGELMQYQRQFVDLYEQVSSRLTETRQYFSTYNTLEATRSVLAREVSILNSIQDNYKQAMSSKSKREKFLESLDSIAKSMVQSLEKEEAKLSKEKKSNDQLNDRYMKLVEKERAFYKTTKEFQEECKLNEVLQSKISQ